jgi:uncharacterized Zn-finger protein
MDKKAKDSNNISPHVVARTDLPLSCPMPKVASWNAHPRVYLPILETGKATCPYCGALYRLEDRES